MLVDSHCHLHFIDYDKLGMDIDSTIDAARASNIEQMLCVATRMEQMPELIKLSEKYHDVVISVGVHPNEEEIHEPTVQELQKYSTLKKVKLSQAMW